MEQSWSSYSNGKQDEVAEEESGWTAYFDDFFDSQTRLNNNDHHQQEQGSVFIDDFGGTKSSSSSIVSDAASYIEYWKKNSNNMSNSNALFGPSPKFSKKLKFKKTRTKEIFSYDDALEDTASSPVNSPKVIELKVGSLKEMEFNQRKVDHDCSGSPMVQVGGFDHQFQLQTERSKDHQMGFEGEINIENNEITNLRKKGMCLVPVSMFANYLG